jgi:hypothetical protein
MLCGGVAAYHRYGVCTVRCAECAYHTYDMQPHHRITNNDEVFLFT